MVFTYIRSNQTVGGWSSEGILQANNLDFPVECKTTHLTSFAMLVRTSTPEMKVCNSCTYVTHVN